MVIVELPLLGTVVRQRGKYLEGDPDDPVRPVDIDSLLLEFCETQGIPEEDRRWSLTLIKVDLARGVGHFRFSAPHPSIMKYMSQWPARKTTDEIKMELGHVYANGRPEQMSIPAELADYVERYEPD